MRLSSVKIALESRRHIWSCLITPHIPIYPPVHILASDLKRPIQGTNHTQVFEEDLSKILKFRTIMRFRNLLSLILLKNKDDSACKTAAKSIRRQSRLNLLRSGGPE